MTVGELIEKLKQYPEDATVVAYSSREDFEELEDDGVDFADVELYEGGRFTLQRAVRIIG